MIFKRGDVKGKHKKAAGSAITKRLNWFIPIADMKKNKQIVSI